MQQPQRPSVGQGCFTSFSKSNEMSASCGTPRFSSYFLITDSQHSMIHAAREADCRSLTLRSAIYKLGIRKTS